MASTFGSSGMGLVVLGGATMAAGFFGGSAGGSAMVLGGAAVGIGVAHMIASK